MTTTTDKVNVEEQAKLAKKVGEILSLLKTEEKTKRLLTKPRL